MSGHGLAAFYGPWSLALVAAHAGESAGAAGPIYVFDGLELPLVQLVLASSGVLLSRPLVKQQDGERGPVKQLAVTLIMMIAAAVWVIEARPGLLFTFVVAIGLGFSGYSLITFAGAQIGAVARNVLRGIAEAAGQMGGKR